MSNTIPTRVGWHPQTRQDRDAVLNELREILANPHFCNSKRYPALLEYIVERTLAGQAESLKERTLGVEVFDRPPTYDTNADTVVRYTAGEVRKRLLLYYSNKENHAGIRISLPPGSYIPEFLRNQDIPEEREDNPDSLVRGKQAHSASEQPFVTADGTLRQPILLDKTSVGGKRRLVSHRNAWLFALGMAVLATIAVVLWGGKLLGPQAAIDDFWGPVLHSQSTVVICSGGNVFSEKNFSGVATAGKEVNYPFVSMQIASSIEKISRVLTRSGVASQLLSSNTTALTDLREHSITLLGGYNNTWTLRLLNQLRFHFAPDHGEYILDQMQPRKTWERDHTLPYSSADDYAVVARFRDSTTDGWVVALAGLGRNGTEAAADFVTSPHYLELLRQQMGHDFQNRNLELVLQVKVIDGKTGAPTILATHSW